MAQSVTNPAVGGSWPLSRTADYAAQYAAPVGRVFLSMIFLLSGMMKLMNWNATAEAMASKGMTVGTHFFLLMAILIEIGGGLSILLGCRARVGAFVVFLFLIPTTFIFHNFWAYSGMEYQEQMQNFMKNLAIMGGLLVIVSLGSGRCSLDNLEARKNTSPLARVR